MTNDAVSVAYDVRSLNDWERAVEIAAGWYSDDYPDDRDIRIAVKGIEVGRKLSTIAPGGAASVELREALQGFVDDLTNSGQNRGSCLSIDHDGLNGRIANARRVLSQTKALAALATSLDAEKVRSKISDIVLEAIRNAASGERGNDGYLDRDHANDATDEILELAAPSHIGNGGEGGAGEPQGTFACPICGKDTPHYHSPEEQEEYREREAWVEDSWQKFKPVAFPERTTAEKSEEDAQGVIRQLRDEMEASPVPDVACIDRGQLDTLARSQHADARLRALEADLQTAINHEVVATCESCMAPLFEGDDIVAGEDCSGCWAAMTDMPSKRERPCYAYRVGKPSAALALGAGER